MNSNSAGLSGCQTPCTPPPMGWNSWYCCSESVSDTSIRKVADLLVDTGLREYGWTWVNVDDCWQGERSGKFHAVQGNERFPDMYGLSQYIHERGLRFGLYSTPWICSYAGFIGGSSDADLHTRVYLPKEERKQPHQLAGGYPGVIQRGLNRIGADWHLTADARQWADWGVDLVKVDWWPNDVPTTRRIYQDLQQSGGNILLSLSNNAQLEYAPELMECAFITRISGDIEDSWESIQRNGFTFGNRWRSHIRPGHYIDPDMLQIGCLGKPNHLNKESFPTRLTLEEQRLQISLWSLLSAPLLLSCDLEKMDQQTFAILTNRDVIAIDQDAAAAVPDLQVCENGLQVYTKPMADGGYACGVFNTTDEALTYETVFASAMYEVWTQERYDAVSCSIDVPPHGVRLFRTH